MDKNLLMDLIEQGFSTREIGIKLNKSQGSVKHWLKKYDLKTKFLQCQPFLKKDKTDFKYCPCCDKKKN
jgi:transposase